MKELDVKKLHPIDVGVLRGSLQRTIDAPENMAAGRAKNLYDLLEKATVYVVVE